MRISELIETVKREQEERNKLYEFMETEMHGNELAQFFATIMHDMNSQSDLLLAVAELVDGKTKRE